MTEHAGIERLVSIDFQYLDSGFELPDAAPARNIGTILARSRRGFARSGQEIGVDKQRYARVVENSGKMRLRFGRNRQNSAGNRLALA